MNNNAEQLNQQVIKEFGLKNTIESYEKAAESGLWCSEKELIEKYFKKASSVLDVGCGTGRTTMPLFDMGYDVLGIDITPEMIQAAENIARKLNKPIPYEIGDASDLRFKNEFFDNILFSFNGWNQIPTKQKRAKALREISRVLKKNGYFIFTAHMRKYFGKYFLTWLKEAFKHFILKPLGRNFGNLEFGDVFFSRDSTTQYSNKQYIHIASVKDIDKMISDAGFELIFSDFRNKISTDDFSLESEDCRFFVCKK